MGDDGLDGDQNNWLSGYSLQVIPGSVESAELQERFGELAATPAIDLNGDGVDDLVLAAGSGGGELLGVQAGETTPDRRFSVETVACLGTCFLAPVVMIDHDYYGSATADKVVEILEEYE